jgi:hypothetical protein
LRRFASGRLLNNWTVVRLPEFPDQIVPDQLLAQFVDIGICADMYELNVHDFCPIAHDLGIQTITENRMVGAATSYQLPSEDVDVNSLSEAQPASAVELHSKIPFPDAEAK